MGLIRKLLDTCVVAYVDAVDVKGERVTPRTAYCVSPKWLDSLQFVIPGSTTRIDDFEFQSRRPQLILVECGTALPHTRRFDEGVLDHHHPSQTAANFGPDRAFEASSLAQVISVLLRYGLTADLGWEVTGCVKPFQLGEEMAGEIQKENGVYVAMQMDGDILCIPNRYVVAGAADHNLPASYRGEVYGVAPEAVLGWRAECLATSPGADGDAEKVVATVRAAREELSTASWLPVQDELIGSIMIRDMRTRQHGEGYSLDYLAVIEAAMLDGEKFLVATRDVGDSREKWCLGGHTTPDEVTYWMNEWAPAHGLKGIYGVPERGFAGGYVT
jgi:hypothetical protein